MISPDGKTIRFQERIQAPAAFVYSLWSVAVNIPKWWTPNVKRFDMEFKEGENYRIIWSTSSDPIKQPYGQYTKIIPGKQIEMTWLWDSISPTFSSDIKLLFNENAGETLFEFTHINLSVPAEVLPRHEAWEELMGY